MIAVVMIMMVMMVLASLCAEMQCFGSIRAVDGKFFMMVML